MSKRGKVGQAKHDNKVIKEAERLRGEGFRVWADLPGKAKPPKVGGKIPDIYARNGNKLIVEEIETQATLKSDKDQQQKLKDGTEDRGGIFKVKVAR